MSDLLRCRRASEASTKLHLLFIIYYIAILFQVLTVRVLADVPVSANTVDPKYGHIPSKTVEAQILGGTSASEGEFPYMVAIYKDNLIICSGVILSSRWVLTKAECMVDPNRGSTSTPELYGSKSDYIIGYGSSRNTALDRVSIKDVLFHSQYDPREFYYDLALIELSTSLPSSEKWRPVRITPKTVSSGDELIVVGWGRISNSERASTLQKIQLKAGSDSECEHDSPKWDGHNGDFVCTASGRGRGVCYGDGGGPLVLPNSPDSDEGFVGYMVGMLSFFTNVGNPTSRGCADSDLVTAYFTRVAKHVDWIASVMGVKSSELLATPKSSESDKDDKSGSRSDEDDEPGSRSEDGRFIVNSVESFLLEKFDATLLSITLCLLVLAVIAFNN
jgi:secreted trypsin-like serine protease